MAQRPPNIALADLNEARKPNSGGEFQVWVSPEDMLEVARFTCTSPTSGTLSIDAGFAAALLAEPRDLVAVVAATALQPSANVTLAITGHDADAAPLNGVATIAVPSWLGSSTRFFPPGFAVDVVVAAGKLFETIEALVPANAVAGAQFILFSMPLQSSYERIGCATGIDYNDPVSGSRAVACGLDGSAFTKRARSEPGELTLTAKDFNQMEGLAKYRGASVTVMLKLLKDERIHTHNFFFSSYRAKTKNTHGDGDDDSSVTATGMFEKSVVLMAVAAE